MYIRKSECTATRARAGLDGLGAFMHLIIGCLDCVRVVRVYVMYLRFSCDAAAARE